MVTPQPVLYQISASVARKVRRNTSVLAACREPISPCTERLAEHMSAVELKKVRVWMLTYGETSCILIVAANLG